MRLVLDRWLNWWWGIERMVWGVVVCNSVWDVEGVVIVVMFLVDLELMMMSMCDS